MPALDATLLPYLVSGAVILLVVFNVRRARRISELSTARAVADIQDSTGLTWDGQAFTGEIDDLEVRVGTAMAPSEDTVLGRRSPSHRRHKLQNHTPWLLVSASVRVPGASLPSTHVIGWDRLGWGGYKELHRRRGGAEHPPRVQAAGLPGGTKLFSDDPAHASALVGRADVRAALGRRRRPLDVRLGGDALEWTVADTVPRMGHFFPVGGVDKAALRSLLDDALVIARAARELASTAVPDV